MILGSGDPHQRPGHRTCPCTLLRTSSWDHWHRTECIPSSETKFGALGKDDLKRPRHPVIPPEVWCLVGMFLGSEYGTSGTVWMSGVRKFKQVKLVTFSLLSRGKSGWNGRETSILFPLFVACGVFVSPFRVQHQSKNGSCLPTPTKDTKPTDILLGSHPKNPSIKHDIMDKPMKSSASKALVLHVCVVALSVVGQITASAFQVESLWNSRDN